jgi:LPS export ABC transporter permease LptG/LPS export ABC transporter permease LptF
MGRSRRHFVLARSLIREMVPTFLLGTGVTTFLLLIRSLFFLADLFISHSGSLAVAGTLLLLGLPNIVVLTIPIGVLFSVLMTAARLSADSELIAVQSSGIRLTRLARPLLGVAFVLFLLDAVLTVQVMPWTNRAFQDLTRKTALSGIRAAVEQGVFTDEFPDHLLYVNRINPRNSRWHGILLFDLAAPGEERLITANSGEFVQDGRSSTAWLNLEDTTTYQIQPNNPRGLQLTSNREQRILLQPAMIANARVRHGVRETSSTELLERVRDHDGEVSARRDALIELNKRFAIPAATFVFALLGFPLGVRNRRGGKGFGLTASVLLVVAYYVLLNNGEILARAGTLPVGLGTWLPNLILLGLGVVLLRRAARGLQRERRPWRLFRRRAVNSGALPARTAASRNGRSRLRCAPGGVGRPNNGIPAHLLGIIDRNLVRQCLAFFALVLIAIFAIYVTVNLSENIDDIQKNGVPLLVIASYYLFSLPQIVHDILPLVFLIAFLGTTTMLERHNETTALRAAGVSLTRVAASLLGLAFVLGVGLFVMDESVAQRANRTAQRLEEVIKGRKIASSYRATDRPYVFLPDGRTLVNFLQFDADNNTLLQPSIYVFDVHFNLRSFYIARQAVYRGDKWWGEHASSRVPGPDGTVDFVQHTAPVPLPIDVQPSYFGREYRKPSQMSFGALLDYIETLRAAGYRADRLVVRLNQKIAYPLSLVVLAWLALPYAFRMGKRGTIMGIALALVLGMAYFGLTAFVTKLGEAALLPPTLAAWSPTVIFALLAANRHTTLRT